MKIAGKEVFDADKDLNIHVTKEDVRLGALKDAKACAAAIAIKRECHTSKVRIHLGRAYVYRRGKWTRYMTPTNLRSEITAFDKGGRFEPGQYTLVAPTRSQRLDTRSTYEAKRQPRLNKTYRKRHRPTKGVRDRMVADWE